ncbi:hypothetical protein [Blastococcus sp. CT_GayMR20]|nr:hypothetical protein [Blastococcus sp. CT_GayMR20]
MNRPFSTQVSFTDRGHHEVIKLARFYDDGGAYDDGEKATW